MKNPLKVLDVNKEGRDFVISDLHGSYSAFKNLLVNIKFNPLIDRIISVGDLVDRGPDSLGCLGLIREPWFHAVLSNHEQMMIEKFRGGYMGNFWFQNGGQWGIEAYNDYKAIYINHTRNFPSNDHSAELFDLLPLVEELPFLITVNMPNDKKYHVVHAELPYYKSKIITDDMLSDPDTVLKLAKTSGGDGDAFLWSRFLFGDHIMRPLEDVERIIYSAKYAGADKFFTDQLSHVISGHSILQHPLTIVGQTNIDTGAFKSYWIPVEPYQHGGQSPVDWAALTCVELSTWKFYKATAEKFTEVTPVVISKEDILAYKD